MNLKNKLHLVDSVILIDHLNGVKEATNWLHKNGSKNSVISVITRAEILAGTEPHEKYHITALLDEFECLPIEKDISELAAELRQRYKIKLPDAFQAALANHHELKLVTRNTKDFSPRMKFVKIPYRL